MYRHAEAHVLNFGASFPVSYIFLGQWRALNKNDNQYYLILRNDHSPINVNDENEYPAKYETLTLTSNIKKFPFQLKLDSLENQEMRTGLYNWLMLKHMVN